MILKIYSSFGVLECEPMTLQAIEKSIPTVTASNKEEPSEPRTVAVDSPPTDF